MKRSSESAFLALLNVFDRRINVPRRVRRWYRHSVARARQKLSERSVRLEAGGWLLLVTIAAAFRLYRPLNTANLGYADTYGHMYLMMLIQGGQQVDPEWGPYPVGLHFLMLTIHHLTNVDPILLLNAFGAVVGIIMTMAVAYAARYISGNLVAGITSGLLFATLVGGPGQYFVLGGVFAGVDRGKTVAMASLPYDELARTPVEFDLTLRTFQRQTSTLSQELAIALLFPTVVFLFEYLRRRSRWHLYGFAGGVAAIAAVHSGVMLPMAIMAVLAVLATVVAGEGSWMAIRRGIFAAVVAVIAGSAWMLAFLRYPAGTAGGDVPAIVWNTALKYFPFLTRIADTPRDAVAATSFVHADMTPFLGACILVAVFLIIAAFRSREERRANLLWASLVFFVFLAGHFAPVFGLPQIVDMRRNAQWLLMSMTIVLGAGAVEAGSLFGTRPRLRYAVAAALLLVWMIRVPLLSQPAIRDRLIDYSGFGGSSLAVLNISRSFEPFRWTLVSYGQEFPMVLRRGYHVPALDFLERYDPTAEVTPIPTPSIFIIVEKRAHPFQINAWARRFSRSEIEERLQAWVHVYQATHRNVRVFAEDDDVRVYQIERSSDEIDSLLQRTESR